MSRIPALVRPASRLVLAAVVGALVGAPHPARAAGEVDAFRTKVEKWVQTRQLISEERSGWEADEEALADSKKLLAQEKKGLEDEIADLQSESTAGDEERRELLLRRGEYQRAARSLEERIRALEKEVLALAPRLPEPLQKKLDLLLVQIPDDPKPGDDTQLGARLMNVLGVLAQAEKFNGTATFVGETRATSGDQKIQVRTLYWGLGEAVYVAARGETAGLGHPGARGWEFTDRPEIAREAKRLMDIYEGNVDVIEFVDIPVEIR